MIRVAVISDLHIGEKARSKDFRPEGCDDKSCLEDCYKDDFQYFVRKDNITADYLVISGDITNSASFEEFILARKIIDDLAQSIHVEKSNIICVPGNHDVDWSIMQSANTKKEKEQRKNHRYDPFKESFADANSNLLQLIESPYYTIWDYENISFIGFNSACHDEPDQKFHYGLIPLNIVSELDRELKSLGNKIKVFIAHHHVSQYDIDSGDVDISMMQNADALLKMLSIREIDMVIHGHKHIPEIITRGINGLHTLPILCAGSFSVLLDQKLSGTVLNTFHIINFEGKNPETNYIYGYVENFSYAYPKKWSRCIKENSRLMSKQGFGAYGDVNELARKISPDVQSAIKDKGFLHWSVLCKKHIALNYCHPDVIQQLTEKIETELNVRTFVASDDRIFTKQDK